MNSYTKGMGIARVLIIILLLPLLAACGSAPAESAPEAAAEPESAPTVESTPEAAPATAQPTA